jgi:hypothetical protein
MMSNTVIQALERWSVKRPENKADRGANSSEIESAEARFGFRFAPDYRWFLATYGGGQFGPFALIGLRHSNKMCAHCRDLFIARESNNSVWMNADMAIICDDDSGNLWLMDHTGSVFFSDHEEQLVDKRYNSYSDWFEGELLDQS